MWGIVHNVITPRQPAPNQVECSCGWRGPVAKFAEHVADVAKESRDRIFEFVDLVREEIGNGKWGEIDRFRRITTSLRRRVL